MKKSHIGILLIIIGITIMGAAIFMRYNGYIEQKKIIEEFEKTIIDLNKEQPLNGSNNEQKKNSSNSTSTSSEIKNAIGIMKIPKIDLKVAIGEGVDVNTLKYAVGHFPGTPYPGEKGNSAIAGHRSYTYNEYFNRLDEVVEGDQIIIKTKKGEFTYTVYEKLVVLPEEVSVLNNTKDAELTLITCTPIRVATHRLIIKAKIK